MEFLLDLLSNGTWSLNFFSGSLGIVAYVLQALALYTIAKRRGLNKPWLAWIPVVNVWTLGEIADQYQSVANGKTKKKRKVLLGLSIAAMVVAIICFVVFGIAMWQVAPDFGELPSDTTEVTEPPYGMVGVLMAAFSVFVMYFVIFLLCMIPVFVLLIIIAVFRWMAVYDVFKSCDPKNTTVYFLVGLLGSIFAVSGLESVFMLVCMNKDEGMIPKQPEVQNEIEN